MIYLSVGRLEVDWGKNYGFQDHSALFQPADVRRVSYPYAEGVIRRKPGLSRPLRDVIPRLDLLGHTLDVAKQEFEALAAFNDFSLERFPFSALADALAAVDVRRVSSEYEEEDVEKFFRREIFPRLDLDRYVADEQVKFEAAMGMENLSPYTVLQLLARNPRNLSLPVVWRFADVERGGYAKRESFVRHLDPGQRFLIVTEGSSDAGILKHALKLLRPGIADFFDFVDMQEGYPFSGTGSLFRFVQGLVSIAVQNRIVVLLDNDAEGVSTHQRIAGLNLPPNMIALRLPDLERFRQFRTIGPSGEGLADINGSGAAIECYLDNGPGAEVRWTNYVDALGVYQGALVTKREAMMGFYAVDDASAAYDFSGIGAVLDHIVRGCIGMTQPVVEREFERLRLDV